jgi:hypothetical protein
MARANAEWTTNPLAYELEVLTLVNNEGVGYDIRELMLECNIYESITSNFLMGEIAIADAIGLLENAKIFGQETLRIRFAMPTGNRPAGPDDDLIDQVFRIYKVSGIHRIGQNTTVYKLSFCAPELIHAKRIRISEAHRDSLSKIATKIAINHLGIIPIKPDEDFPKLRPFFENIIGSPGEQYHIVIPNWTVNYAINWLLQHAQGEDYLSGFQDSFFFFQTARGGYRVQSLSDMKTIQYLNQGIFHYAPAAAAGTVDSQKGGGSKGKQPAWDEEETGIGAGRRILDYTVGKTANVLEGTMEGLFAQKQITINNTSKYQTETTFNYLERFFSQSGQGHYPLVRQMPEELSVGEVATADPKSDVVTSKYDNTVIQGKPISDFPEAHTTLTSDSSFVNDEKDIYYQANHNTHLGSEQLRTAVRQLLKYYTMNALISSRTDISCGEWIELKIPPTVGQIDKNPDDGKFHTGRYLITEIKWGLTSQECRTNIKVMKDSYFNQIETASSEYAPLMKLQKGK